MTYTPTHIIKRAGSEEPVMLFEGIAYTAAEWSAESRADYETSDGEWLFQGAAFAGSVTAIEYHNEHGAAFVAVSVGDEPSADGVDAARCIEVYAVSDGAQAWIPLAAFEAHFTRREIVARHVIGLRRTHNSSGLYTRSWRLWSDGTVERTNSASKHQRYISREAIPAPIVEAATARGIDIGGGRPL